MNYAQDANIVAAKLAAEAHSQRLGSGVGYTSGPPPAAISALQEASENMDRSISEVMSLAEMLADRLSPILRPGGPMTAGGNEKEQIRPMASPFVDGLHRQRSRIAAIGSQLADLLDRAQV